MFFEKKKIWLSGTKAEKKNIILHYFNKIISLRF